ncbi:hypothetical protein GCM10007874_48700 [Labrys miyagiensis]|uniref:Secreted protein n=1 Tax=Labrys miyagiensis TaxID=346912 RepID=A0ABQ6CNF0_9HYPH|nr:hypothetical protein [Labrys miyagiensis]GLS21853.1 hypothetical protein GCM10007874_48700 [Labrys miyagiensis]
MLNHAIRIALASAFACLAATTIARADCESDMNQLEKALQTPNLSTAAKAALEEAKTRSVAALKKDDDAACHKAIETGLKKAGIPMQ